MNHTHAGVARARFLNIFLVILFACVCARAQTPAPEAAAGQDAAQNSGATADEDFELNITERRITETDFRASTEVRAGGDGAHGLSLRVGAVVGAEEITLLLRNVRGRVRFRGNLGPLLRLFEARRGPRTTTDNQQYRER